MKALNLCNRVEQYLHQTHTEKERKKDDETGLKMRWWWLEWAHAGKPSSGGNPTTTSGGHPRCRTLPRVARYESHALAVGGRVLRHSLGALGHGVLSHKKKTQNRPFVRNSCSARAGLHSVENSKTNNDTTCVPWPALPARSGAQTSGFRGTSASSSGCCATDARPRPPCGRMCRSRTSS